MHISACKAFHADNTKPLSFVVFLSSEEGVVVESRQVGLQEKIGMKASTTASDHKSELPE